MGLCAPVGVHTLSFPKPRLPYCMKLCTWALAKVAEYPTLQNSGIDSDPPKMNSLWGVLSISEAHFGRGLGVGGRLGAVELPVNPPPQLFQKYMMIM